MNIYLELTERFNTGRFRAVISSGQAVVIYGIAMMSKDGDWILKEEEETMNHILKILSEYDAVYRFGAPLDIRWMSGGWSAHFEFHYEGLRVRTDFVTRPPRISLKRLSDMWEEIKGSDIPAVSLPDLAEIKKTNREKDYAVIGELARLMEHPKDQLLYSRSARDLIDLAEEHKDLISELMEKRPVLGKISEGREKLEEALDKERRALMHVNEARLETYMNAAQEWSSEWIRIKKQIAGCSLAEAHGTVVKEAEGLLPFASDWESSDD